MIGTNLRRVVEELDNASGALAVVLERDDSHDVGEILLHGLRAELVRQHQHGGGLLRLDPLEVLAAEHRPLRSCQYKVSVENVS